MRAPPRLQGEREAAGLRRSPLLADSSSEIAVARTAQRPYRAALYRAATSGAADLGNVVAYAHVN